MKIDDLTKEEQKELEKIQKEIIDEAKKVVKDYADNPTDISGSLVRIHENSPFMDEMYIETGWKHVIHGTIEDGIEAIKKVKKDKKNT